MTAQNWARPGIEPRIEDMVCDPIVKLVMRRDRVTAAEIMATVAEARRRLRPQRATAAVPLAAD